MTSYSTTTGFKIDPNRQIRQLIYSYTSTPKPSVKVRSAPHKGTIVFDMIGTPILKLEGSYWTDRETTGEISLIFREKKLLEEIPEDFSPHPVSEKSSQ